MGLREVIGVSDDDDVEVRTEVFTHGDEGLVHVTKQRGA